MSNMSHCRFQNTLGDLRDCYDALCDEGEMSDDECRAKEALIGLCSQIHYDFGEDDDE